MTTPSPPPPTGELDIARVNVQFTPDVGDPTVLPAVGGATECVAGAHSWYYDDPQAPTRVFLCPTACEELGASVGRLDIVFGCLTIVR